MGATIAHDKKACSGSRHMTIHPCGGTGGKCQVCWGRIQLLLMLGGTRQVPIFWPSLCVKLRTSANSDRQARKKSSHSLSALGSLLCDHLDCTTLDALSHRSERTNGGLSQRPPASWSTRADPATNSVGLAACGWQLLHIGTKLVNELKPTSSLTKIQVRAGRWSPAQRCLLLGFC